MTTFEAVLGATEAEPISSLDLSMFTEADILNVVLQRSQVLMDLPRASQPIRAWVHGNDEPLRAVVAEKGEELVRRALALNYLEYLELKPLLDRLEPKRVADIGCGYAFFDLFVARDYGSRLVLIDLEDNGLRHFQYHDEGAAYTSLGVASDFLVANGCSRRSIVTINPDKQPLEKIRNVDLAVSLISCGFHYPWETYRTFFEQSVMPGGAVVLDLRKRRSEQALVGLKEIGEIETVCDTAHGKACRVLLTTAKKTTAKAA